MPDLCPPRPDAPAWRRVARVLFALAAVGALAWATVSQWSRVEPTVAAVPAGALAAGVAGAAAATYCSMLAWRTVLADLGSRLPWRQAAVVFFAGQLGKYLPGSVWPVVAQMELGRAYGVPRRRSGVAALLVMVFGLAAGGLVAAVTLPFVGELGRYRAALVLPALGLVVLHPAVFRRATAAGLRLLGREPLERTPSARGSATALAWSVAQWLCYGVAVWAVARDLPGAPRGLLLLATGGYALAWCAGFVVVVAPAGAGVREGVLVLLLAPAFGAAPALGIALVARLLATLGDVVWGFVSLVALVRRQDVGGSGRGTVEDPRED